MHGDHPVRWDTEMIDGLLADYFRLRNDHGRDAELDQKGRTSSNAAGAMMPGAV
jgi:hypothetical protein